MNKRIVINKGDEYRFKTEKEFEKEDFFYEVYQKAEAVTKEIFETMQESREELSRTKMQFYGIGNNIIIFCGTRGAGKTSALQSYAYHLENSENKEYVVLDMIDPSELNIGESIVGVFLSRLFSCFHSLYDKSKRSDGNYNEKEMISAQQDILEKFNKCYNNLKYMGQKEQQDFYQDNLDYLSELGDSRNLRKNLFLLAEKVLDYKKKYCPGTSESRQYLAILIDDADLSMGDIFKICEDIRNYFSIPNAVVLMAADFEQLRHAIYQKYLKTYRTILEYDKELKYKNKCYSMATKFMEKMFPNGHRIELPDINHEIQRNADINHEIQRNADVITLEYKEQHEDKKENKKTYTDVFAKEEWNGCNDMQEQLIKSLYVRTGIILEKRYDIQSFLPHTPRELTHFLKLLDSMEVVDFETAVSEGGQGSSENPEEDMPNLMRWKSNLEELKRYYLRYGIQHCLKNKQVQLIKQMEKVNQYDKLEQMAKLVFAYIEENKKEKDIESDTEDTINDFAYLLNHDIRKSTVLSRELQDILYIYFSIVLNSDFVQELLLHRGYNDFVRCLEMPFSYDTAGNGNMVYFPFSADKFKKYSQKYLLPRQGDRAVTRYRELFCIDILSLKSERERQAERGTQKKEETEMWHFNAWGAILRIISGDEMFYSEKDSDVEQAMEGNSLEEGKPTDGGQVAQKTFAYKSDVLISAKNIVCNLEMRFHIESALNKFLSKWSKQNVDYDMQLYLDLYNEIDDAIQDMPYLGIKSTIGRFLAEKLKEYGILWKCSYLSNEEFEKKYLNNMWKDMSALVKNSRDTLNFIKEKFYMKGSSADTFQEDVMQAVNNILTSDKKYSLLEDITIQNTPFEVPLNIQKDIIQAWKNLSLEVMEADVLTEIERNTLLILLESRIKACEKVCERESRNRSKSGSGQSRGKNRR